jgi:predicted metalloprotease
VSGLDNELTADCFAGYMAGFWNINGKLTREELLAGFAVMQFVAKAEPSDSSDMHGDPGQRQGAFFGGFERAKGSVNQQFQNFCKTLDRILEL